MRLFGELTKIEDQPDGTLKVYGVASSGTRDEAGEIVLPAAMKAALPDYALYPALREMHQPSAAGRTLEAEVDGVVRSLFLNFPAVQAPKLSMPLKLDDFTLPQIDMSAQDNGSGNVFNYSMTG